MAAQHVPRVRIRGIYATALTKLLLDEGFQIVQPSRIIAERFKLPQLTLPADVTVKDSDRDPSELVVVGYVEQARVVLERLRERLGYSFYWTSKLPLHSTVKARILRLTDDKCIAEVAGVEAELLVDRGECREGEEVIASVVRPAVKPNETPRLAPGARVIGDYAILIKSDEPRVTISEHVRSSSKRAELAAIATAYTSKGFSVHWRSSSQHADRETLEKHLNNLAAELEEVVGRAEKGEPGVYSRGELVAVVRLSSVDKEELDRVRGEVVPTIKLHHTVKSMAPSYSKIVDYAEKLMEKGVEGEKLSSTLLELMLSDITEKKRVDIVHVKPDGTILTLGKAEVKNVIFTNGRAVITLERKVRTTGVYDGLELPKEPGDTIVTEVELGSWTITHKYYDRNGQLKGTYININTPPEVGEDAIVYLDLEVDVVKKPGEKPRIIDLDKLRKAHEEGIIPEKLYRKALQVVESLTGTSIEAESQK